MQLPQVFPTARDESGGLSRAFEQIAALLLAALTLLYAIWTSLGGQREQAVIAGALGLALCLVARQITALQAQAGRLAEHDQHDDEARSTGLVRHLHDVAAILDADGTIQYVSPSIEDRLGRPAAALRGTSAFALVMPDDAPAARTLLADAVASPHERIVTDLRLRGADGTYRACEAFATSRLDDSSVRGVVVTLHDVTERRALEHELRERAVHDRLTGLPNRTLVLDRVGRAIARAERRHQRVAVLFVDLDNFKLVNDSLGLPAGDELLTQVADRIQGCLRTEDTLGRVAGDELVILIEDVDHEDAAIAVAERVLAALRAPFAVGGQSLFTTASIGIALSGPTADQPTSLLRNADLAMYEAKGRGKACWRLFSPKLGTTALERLGLEMTLRGALARGELHLVYQPIVDLASGEIREVEALLRWASPERGSVPPSQFIPVAEETGLILQIGTWTLREACWQVTRWNAERLDDPLTVGVNLSGRQLQDPSLVETVIRILGETGLDAACLKLELTESVMMEDAEATIETLSQLKALGVQLAIDDFGTGYSSLAYLKRFPVDVLKVDRSFVDGLGTSQQDAAIVQGVLVLAQNLGLVVTAEGVEREEQEAWLERSGCALAQGYYFSKPLLPDALAALLRRADLKRDDEALPPLPVPSLPAPALPARPLTQVS